MLGPVFINQPINGTWCVYVRVHAGVCMCVCAQVCVCACACRCVYVRARRCVCAQVCVCAFGCCFAGANGLLADVCQCCCLLMFVCLPLLRHFPCCKTWSIKNLRSEICFVHRLPRKRHTDILLREKAYILFSLSKVIFLVQHGGTCLPLSYVCTTSSPQPPSGQEAGAMHVSYRDYQQRMGTGEFHRTNILTRNAKWN